MSFILSCIGNALAYTCFSLVGECVNFTMSQAVRFSYLLIGLIVFSIAVILGKCYPEKFLLNYYYTDDPIFPDITDGCAADYTYECIYRQLIYRASMALTCCFVFMTGMAFLSDAANKKYWIAKLILTVGLFVGFFWGSNGFFSGWSEVARFISFIWILVQGLLILDFAHDMHDVIMARASEAEEEETGGDRTWYIIYLILSGGFLAAAITGLVFLYRDYAGCELGMFFIVFTTVVGSLTTIVSLLDSVNKGLLTPCIMFAYAVFMCWYALISSPDEQCNPISNLNDGKKTIALIVTVVISTFIMIYCVAFGTKILNLFNADGEGVISSYAQPAAQNPAIAKGDLDGIEIGVENTVDSKPSGRGANVDALYEQTSGTTQERVFFHVLMILFSSYGLMILTSWGYSDGTPENANNEVFNSGKTSMWLKIVAQWLFFLMYARALQVAYQDNNPDK